MIQTKHRCYIQFKHGYLISEIGSKSYFLLDHSDLTWFSSSFTYGFRAGADLFTCLILFWWVSLFYVLQVVRALGGGNGEKRRGGLHLARPKSPNMQELKRRFRQVLSSKVKSATTI